MKKLHFLPILFLVFLFLSCKKQNEEVKPTDPTTLRASQILPIICSEVKKADGNYGDPSNPRNNFSLRYFTNSSCGKTPLIIAIHGGGFYSGNKDLMMPDQLNKSTNLSDIAPLLTYSQLTDNRIAYATINYRYTINGLHLDAPLNDCKAFLAYIRNHAEEYNIDPNRIILLGFSAGATSALWVGLQDPTIKGIIAFSPQASLNVIRWQPEIFQPYGMNRTGDIFNFFFTGNPPLAHFYFGTTNVNQINQYSNLNKLHLPDLMDSNDPELFLATGDIGYEDLIHNACHVYTLKQKAQQVGLNARIALTRNPYYLNPNAETIIQFCLRKF